MTTVDFAYTGAEQTWVVPAGVSEVVIDAYGAQGGKDPGAYGPRIPALGGRAQGTLAVTPGETLWIYVGGCPTGTPGGGGASDVRQGGSALANRKIVAGGGGGTGNRGSGSTLSTAGGAGGGLTGDTGSQTGGALAGQGGTQSAGGAAGAGAATAGSLGQGGNAQSTNQGPGGWNGGGAGGFAGTSQYRMGAGGGGYYGGGGAGNGGTNATAGGGGGSSYIGGVTSGSTTPGVRTGDGAVSITYTVAPPPPDVPVVAVDPSVRVIGVTPIGGGRGTTTPETDAELNAGGTFTATASAAHTADAELAGAGGFSATATAVHTTAAELTATGGFLGVVDGSVDAALTGGGGFTATAIVDPIPTARITSSGSFTGTAVPILPPAAPLTGHGYFWATAEPAVDAPPPGMPLGRAVITAAAYTGHTVTAGPPSAGMQVTLEGHVRCERTRQRHRIVVAGRDITWWRGVATPPPSYSLVEPLLYGSGVLELPQVAAPYEQPGHGDLAWLRPGARVVVQRVDADGDVVATDFRGILLDPDISGRTVRYGLAGEVTGPAAVRFKPQPIDRGRNDLGFWWARAITALGARFVPADGPETGIRLDGSGGVYYTTHLAELARQGVTAGGTQYTCMPTNPDQGAPTYRVAPKDTTTIHATVYLDDHLAVPSLRRDPAEEPNRVFARAVTPAGRRVRFGVYPALKPVDAPDFPGPMSEGDTDADTTTGGGVTALTRRLYATGYLSFENLPGGFDADVVTAVRDLQRDAGLPVTGTVNEATWEALHDVGVTGYNSAGSHIEPAAQRPEVQRFLRTASGLVSGPNPDYDPSVLVVDREIDFGTGHGVPRVRRWSRQALAPSADTAPNGNWVGRIDLPGGAVIAGEHNPGDPLTASDLMDARNLRPGMNLWLPLWAGGTLLHISGVEVASRDGLTWTKVIVDTQARDTLEVWQVIARNRAGRRNPTRAWLDDHRASGRVDDVVTEFEEVGGLITDTPLSEGWNVLPVVAGSEGTIARLRLTTTPSAELVVAVFGRQISASRIAGIIGNPLTEEGANRWGNIDDRAALEDRVLLYAGGLPEQPGGYSPGKKNNRDGTPTGQPLTGRYEDDAGFAYRTFDNSCVLWLAVYADRATTIGGGRIMWPQDGIL